MIFRSNGTVDQVESPGTPFGMVEEMEYEEATIDLQSGDNLLLFSDGVFEVHNAQEELLGVEGLIAVLKTMGYPEKAIDPEGLEKQILKFSNAIRLDDDVTLIEARFS